MVLSKIKKLFGGGSPRLNIKDRFEIKGKSGMGSMSKVFRAFDKQLKKTVCLKLLDPTKTAQFEARFAGMKKPSEGEVSLALRFQNEPYYAGPGYLYANLIFVAMRLLREHGVGNAPLEPIPEELFQRLHLDPEKSKQAIQQVVDASEQINNLAAELAA